MLELDTKIGLEDESESGTEMNSFESVKMGGNITWSDPVVTEHTQNRVTRPGRVIRLPDRLMYTPAIELSYLGEMAELEQLELTAINMSIRSIELSLVGAGVRGGIKHTKDLRVLNFKKAMRSPDANEWHTEINKEKE